MGMTSHLRRQRIIRPCRCRVGGERGDPCPAERPLLPSHARCRRTRHATYRSDRPARRPPAPVDRHRLLRRCGGRARPTPRGSPGLPLGHYAVPALRQDRLGMSPTPVADGSGAVRHHALRRAPRSRTRPVRMSAPCRTGPVLALVQKDLRVESLARHHAPHVLQGSEPPTAGGKPTQGRVGGVAVRGGPKLLRSSLKGLAIKVPGMDSSFQRNLACSVGPLPQAFLPGHVA